MALDLGFGKGLGNNAASVIKGKEGEQKGAEEQKITRDLAASIPVVKLLDKEDKDKNYELVADDDFNEELSDENVFEANHPDCLTKEDTEKDQVGDKQVVEVPEKGKKLDPEADYKKHKAWDDDARMGGICAAEQANIRSETTKELDKNSMHTLNDVIKEANAGVENIEAEQFDIDDIDDIDNLNDISLNAPMEAPEAPVLEVEEEESDRMAYVSRDDEDVESEKELTNRMTNGTWSN